jgi:hypothetical protein
MIDFVLAQIATTGSVCLLPVFTPFPLGPMNFSNAGRNALDGLLPECERNTVNLTILKVPFYQMRTNSRNCAGLDARKLIESATAGGAKSLGLHQGTGEFAIGKYLVIPFRHMAIKNV